MQLIVILGIIAKLASVSDDCCLGKTVHDNDFNKVSSDTYAKGLHVSSSDGAGSLLLSSVCGVFKSTVSRSDHSQYNDVIMGK